MHSKRGNLRGAFISTPMSSLSEEELDIIRRFCGDLRASIVGEINDFEFYCAALNKDNGKSFDDPVESAFEDFRAIKNLEGFVLLFPQASQSSALIELGYALALEKRVLLIASKLDDLPFLARGLSAKEHSTEVFVAYPFGDESRVRILSFLQEV